MRLLLATLLVAATTATTACSATLDPASRSAPGLATPPSETPACAEVRAGIAAFNEGDYDETVARFVAAVPLAEEQVDGSKQADDLLEAIRWYAELPAEDYPEAAISSQDFATYKAITLGQCDPVVTAETEPPGTEV
ncbi:hypothetical protein [Nocardioides sp.]|uniref:hypothetical protein n=1 Tax=Nocardioides sp. TaxID=35761 RepID=UPI00286A4A4B|nr:hypothetical protein [Nocardioides sp.]